MNKKILKLIILLVLLLLIIFSIFMIMKNSSKKIILSSLDNTEKILKSKDYRNVVDINVITNVNDKKIESRINNSYIKNGNKYKIDIKQYTNNTLTNSSTNYIEKDGKNYIFYYYLGNNLQRQEIDNLNSKIKFNIKYSYLKKIINNYNYIGKIENNLYKYSVDIKEYDAYNFIYSSKILSNKNTDATTKLYLYIDKKSKIIYKIYFDINKVKENDEFLKYNMSIDNYDIGKTKTIKIPNK